MPTYTDDEERQIQEWRADNPLRRWRKARGLSLRIFSIEAGLSYDTLTSGERGRRKISDDILDVIQVKTGEDDIAERWREWETMCPVAVIE